MKFKKSRELRTRFFAFVREIKELVVSRNWGDDFKKVSGELELSVIS